MKRRLIAVGVILLLSNAVTFYFTRQMTPDTQTITERYPEIESVDRNEPVATIAGETILFDTWMEYLENQYGRTALEDLISDRVVRELSQEENISIHPRVIDLEVAHLHTIYGQVPENEVEQTEAEWRERIESRLLRERLLTRDVNISSEEIERYYQSFSSDYDFSRRIEISEIRVSDSETAELVYAELEGGADFNALAREYATSDEAVASGGYLGFYAANSSFLSASYTGRLLELEPFSYTEIFQDGGDYVIAKLHRDVTAVELSLEEATDYIRTQLAIEELAYIPDASILWDEKEVEWIY